MVQHAPTNRFNNFSTRGAPKPTMYIFSIMVFAIFPHEVLLNQPCTYFQLWYLLIERRNSVSRFCKLNITFISVELYKDQFIATN